MKILSTVLAASALFFSGCSVLAKAAPRTNYFMLGGAEDKFKECENKPEKTVFIEEVRVFGAYESREVLKIDPSAKKYQIFSAPKRDDEAKFDHSREQSVRV